MTQIPASPISPDQLARMQWLTQEYARLSSNHAGMSALLGGAFLMLTALVEATGHQWRFSWGRFVPLPLWAGLTVACLPFAWLLARKPLHAWATHRFGLVEPPPTPAPLGLKARVQRVVFNFVFPGAFALGIVLVWTQPLPHQVLRSLLLTGLGATLFVMGPRFKTKLDRVTAILLFMGGFFILSGVQMATLDSFLAYPLVGVIALTVGIKDHLAFKKVQRELA